MPKTNIYVTITDTPEWDKERAIDYIEYLQYQANNCANAIKKAIADDVDEIIIEQLKRYWRTILNKNYTEAILAFGRKYNEKYFETAYYKRLQEEQNNE